MAKTNSNIVTPFNMGPYGAPIVLNVTRFCHKTLNSILLFRSFRFDFLFQWGPFMDLTQKANNDEEDFVGLCREILDSLATVFNFT